MSDVVDPNAYVVRRHRVEGLWLNPKFYPTPRDRAMAVAERLFEDYATDGVISIEVDGEVFEWGFWNDEEE